MRGSSAPEFALERNCQIVDRSLGLLGSGVSIRRLRSCIDMCSMQANFLNNSFCDALLLCSGISIEKELSDRILIINTCPHLKRVETWGGEALPVILNKTLETLNCQPANRSPTQFVAATEWA